MKNKNTSFAAESKRLIKLYSRASFDTNERRELDAALQKLSEEQELYKQVNKIGEYSDEAMAQKAMQQQQMMAQQSQGQFPQGQPQMQPDSQVGQMPQFPWGGLLGGDYFPQQPVVDNNWNMVNSNPYIQSNQPSGVIANNNNSLGVLQSQGQVVPSYQAPSYNWQTQAGQHVPGDTYNIGGNNVKMTNPGAFNSGTAIDVSAKATQPAIGQDQQLGMTQSILPSVIAGGIGMLGNTILGATTKTHPIDFKQRYSAEQISLAKERERLSREAITARNIGMRNLSGAGSRGAYLAGAGNVSAGVNQQLSDALSQSYFKEGMTNMGQREKAYDKNFELDKQIAMMNYQDRVNADNERRAYYAAAAGQAGKISKDINEINYQNAALLSSGTDNYLAGTNTKPNMWKSQQIMRKFNRTDGVDTGVRKVIGYTEDRKPIYNK